MKFLAVVIAALPLVASAATITVNTTADNTVAGDHHCTLREAIANVNAATDTTGGDCAAGTSMGDTIVFQIKLPARIRLAKSTLTLQGDVTITGPGSDSLTIDGRSRMRVLEITGGTVSVSGLTVRGGKVTYPNGNGEGGGILVDSAATLFLSSCKLLKNKVISAGSATIGGTGGAIYVAGAATLTDCTIDHNTATGGAGRYGYGGGVFVDASGTVSVTDCTITHNTSGGTRRTVDDGVGGGGIANAGSMILAGCTISENITRGRGAGFENLSSGSATLSNCTLTNNATRYSGAGGGGFDNVGNAELVDCTMSGNASGGGSGVKNTGTFTLSNCGITNNVSTGMDNGGTAVLAGCTIGSNSDGGIVNAGTLTATSTVIELNGRVGFSVAGGLRNFGTAALTDCTISNNIGFSGGGLTNEGTGATLNLTRCALIGNAGGAGIFNYQGSFVVTNSILANNDGDAGGAVFSRGNGTLRNSTVIGNTADYGGGINTIGTDNSVHTTVINCTIAGNLARGHNVQNGTLTGGGIYGQASLWTLTNTAIALNEPNDCYVPASSNGHNLDSDGTCFSSGGTDLPNVDPMLAPLGNYGGSTQTAALCTAVGAPDPSCEGPSPAIDAGDDSVTGPPDNITTDQRGLPRLSGTHVDIGAYEAQ